MVISTCSHCAATQFTVYPHKFHGWMMLSKLPATLAAVDEITQWIAARLDAAIWPVLKAGRRQEWRNNGGASCPIVDGSAGFWSAGVTSTMWGAERVGCGVGGISG